jgi:hypothetical protein
MKNKITNNLLNKDIIFRWLKPLLPLFFIFIASLGHTQQPTYKLQELFMDAETWFYFQDYKNSLPLYLRVHEAYPENHNVNYKIGFCYLNIEGQKEKAIPYLKKAAENTTFNYNREAFYEKEAPVDALFYLANAYLINNQFNKALEYYNAFEKKIENNRGLFSRRNSYDKEYLLKQKEACRNAKKLMNEPVNFTAKKLGMSVNTPMYEYNPVVSGDQKTLVFTSERKFYTGVFMVKKENGKWGPPVNLLPQLGIDGDCETTSLSYDGKELYLYREDELDGNLYVSYYENGEWSNIQKLGENINTKYWESHATISADGEKLYFVSNREGGIGDLDIYVSERLPNGKWGEAKNIGTPINTQWREDTPFLTQDGNTMFFSSEGHYNMGGFDIFVAHKTEDGWTQPQNIGYPINTTDDDKFFVPLNNGEEAYYANFNKTAAGQKDIFKYTLKDLETIDFIDIEGIFTYEPDKKNEKKITQINVINTVTNDTIAKLDPEKQSKFFSYQKIDGKNHLVYQTPALKNNEQYLISQDFGIRKKTAQKLPDEKVEERKEEKEKPQPTISLDNKIFKATSENENIKIKLQLKDGNKLIVNTFQNDKLINTEEFPVKEDEFIYEYQPTGKETKIKFSLIDENNNKQTRDVSIIPEKTGTKPKDKEPQLDVAGKSYSLASGKKKVTIKLNVEKNSKLFVSTFIDDKLIDEEEFDIKQETFTYEVEPKKEKSKINFKLVDQNNNVRNKEVIISHKPIDKNLEELLKKIDKTNNTPVKNRIQQIQEESTTSEDFINKMFKETKESSIPKENLKTFLYASVLLAPQSLEEFHMELLDLSGKTPINDYLKSISTKDYNSKNDYLSNLIRATQKNNFTVSDIQKLLHNYLATQYSAGELADLMTKFANINLSSVFKDLQTETSDIVSVEDLLKYLRQNDTPHNRKILAYIMAVELTEIKTESEEKKEDKEKEDKQVDRNLLWWIAGAAIILILLMIIVSGRRKRKKNN